MKRTIKEICIWLLVAVTAFACMPSITLFAGIEIGAAVVYADTGGNYDGVDWSIDEDGTLVLGDPSSTQTLADLNRTQESYPWYPYRESIHAIRIDGPINAQGSLCGMFYEMTNATAIEGLEDFDTSAATSLRGMFYGGASFREIDVSGFNTENATDIAGLFNGCSNLTTADLSSFNTARITTMVNLFKDCNSLVEVDISGFDTQNVTTMMNMFDSCYSLKKIVIGSDFKVPASYRPVFPSYQSGAEKYFANSNADYATHHGVLTNTAKGAYAGTWLTIAEVAFDPSGGQGSMQNQKIYYGEPAKPLMASTYYKNDGCFRGWLVSDYMFSDEDLVDYAALETAGMEEGQITLSAQWDSHVMQRIKAKAPTCTDDGNKQYFKCSECNRSYADEEGTEQISEDAVVIPSLGCDHDWGDWKEIKAPSDEGEGEAIRICSICRDKETTAVPHTDISGATVTGIVNKTYTGKGLTQTPVVMLDGIALVKDTDYIVSYATNKNVGTATVVITGTGRYTGSVFENFTISKATNPLTVKGKTATVKYSKVKAKTQTLAVSKVITVSKNQGKVSYAKSSGNSKITINKSTGKVSVKKGLKKGTYTVKVKVTAAGNGNYKSVTKTATFKIKVK